MDLRKLTINLETLICSILLLLLQPNRWVIITIIFLGYYA